MKIADSIATLKLGFWGDKDWNANFEIKFSKLSEKSLNLNTS